MTSLVYIIQHKNKKKNVYRQLSPIQSDIRFTRLQILIFCKRAKKEINIQYKYVYLQAHKEKGR